MSLANPRTGAETVASLRAAFPTATITSCGRAAFGAGTLIRIEADGHHCYIASKERRWVQDLDGMLHYTPPRSEWQGRDGWLRFLIDLRDAMGRIP